MGLNYRPTPRIEQIVALVGQYPAGITGQEVARRAFDAPTGLKIRAFCGLLGVMAARGLIERRGGLYYPCAPAAPAAPPAGWYALPGGPRYWDGSRWL